MFSLFVFLAISCQGMELSLFPHEGDFRDIPNELLKDVFYYADVQRFEAFVAQPLDQLVNDYTDEVVEKSFLPLATLHLVDKRFLAIFSQMCTNVIKKACEKNFRFPCQRYCFAPHEFKTKSNQLLYHQNNLLHFQLFVDNPKMHQKQYTIVKCSSFNYPDYKSLFKCVDPFYRLSYVDFTKQFKSQITHKSSDFVNLVEKYIPVYREIFSSPNAQDFNLFTLVALGLVSEGQKTNDYYKNNLDSELLTFFYWFFVKGPFVQTAKDFFLKKFTEQPCDDCLKDIFIKAKKEEDDAQSLNGYLCHRNLLFRQCSYALLKELFNLPKSSLKNHDKKFLMRLYILIFALGHNKDLQDYFKNDFAAFFNECNCQVYLEAIESVCKKAFDFWTVFNLLSSVIDETILKTFLKHYSPDGLPKGGLAEKQLYREEFLFFKPNHLFKQPEMKTFLDTLNGSEFGKEFLKNHPFCLYFIELFDKNIKRLNSHLNQFKFLYTLVDVIGRKTELHREDIVTILGIRDYSSRLEYYNSINNSSSMLFEI